MLKIVSLMVLSTMLSCLGRTGPDGCSSAVTAPALVSSENFKLSALGGSHSCGDWTITANPGVLEADAQLTCEIHGDARLGYWHAHEQIAPIRILARVPPLYAGTPRIRATLHHSTVDVRTQTVLDSPSLLAEPDFSRAPAEGQKSYIVAPQLSGSITPDSGWLFTIAQENEESQKCLAQSLTELAKQIGDKISPFLSNDPCAACKSITSALTQIENCETLVNNLNTTVCDAFLAESAKDSWSSTLLNYGCKGASWLGLWAANYKLQGGLSDSICKQENVVQFKTFIAQYKSRSACMCELFIRDSRCKAPADAMCEQIWNDVTGAK